MNGYTLVAIAFGLLVADAIVANICRVFKTKILLKEHVCKHCKRETFKL